MKRTRTAITAGAAIAGAALVLSACGSGPAASGGGAGSGGPGSGASSTTPTTTTHGRTVSVLGGAARAQLFRQLSHWPATMRMSIEESVPISSGESEQITIKGSISNTSGLGAFTFLQPGIATPLSMVIDTKRGEVFVKVPASDVSRAGKPWIEESIASYTAGGAASLDPDQEIGELKSEATKVEADGDRTINGSWVHVYVITVPATKALANAEKVLGQSGATHIPGNLEYHVFVDSQGHTVGIATSVPESMVAKIAGSIASSSGVSGTSTAPSTPPGSITVSATMSDFGVAVHVSIPPASEVRVVKVGTGGSSGTGVSGSGGSSIF